MSGAVSPPTEKTTSVSLLVFGPIRPTWQTTKTESKRPSGLEVTAEGARREANKPLRIPKLLHYFHSVYRVLFKACRLLSATV